jgi:hypothetical protein
MFRKTTQITIPQGFTHYQAKLMVMLGENNGTCSRNLFFEFYRAADRFESKSIDSTVDLFKQVTEVIGKCCYMGTTATKDKHKIYLKDEYKKILEI